MKEIEENICQYSNKPTKSMHVNITPNAANTLFTSKLVLIVTYFENEVKQLLQNVMNKRFTSIVKNEINKSNNNENNESFR